MSNFISDMEIMGVTVDEDIQRYLSNFDSSSSSSSGANSTWLQYIRPKRFMNETILIGGMSELDFPFGTVISHPNTNQRLMGAVTNRNLDLSVWAAGISDRFRHLMSRGSQTNVMFPVAHNLHWGMVIVKDQKIYWSDSLRQNPFQSQGRSILDVTKALFKNLFPESDWVIQKNSDGTLCNYMIDVLNYDLQKDGYSCGFYVLATLCTFAESFGEISAFPYHNYDPRITEAYRSASVRGYFKRVKEIYAEKRETMKKYHIQENRTVRVSEADVMVSVTCNRLRFFLTPVEPITKLEEQEQSKRTKMRLSNDESIELFGITAKTPSEYVDELKNRKEFFSSRKEVAVRNKAFNTRKLYSCFRYRQGCKAILTGRYYPKEGVWRMTKSKVHNHGLVSPTPVVHRQNQK